MSAKTFVGLFALAAVSLAAQVRADDVDPEPPPRLAGEVVRVEVNRFTDRDGSKARTLETAKHKDLVRNLLAHFPEAATGRKPTAGPPGPSGLSYSVVLRRDKGGPVHIFVRDDGRLWYCYHGTVRSRADWALRKPKETARFLDGLLDP